MIDDYDRAEIRASAARGAALLDTIDRIWFFAVDNSTLAMYDVRDCILGQLYGTFSQGLEELNLHVEAEPHGFCADDYEPLHEAYDILTSAWNDEITNRLESI